MENVKSSIYKNVVNYPFVMGLLMFVLQGTSRKRQPKSTKLLSRFSRYYLACCGFIFAAGGLHAETIELQPGQNVISTAISEAADGDTLLLAAGQYKEDSNVVVDKILTIKGASKDNKPELTNVKFRIMRTESREYGTLTFQNLFFNDGNIADNGYVNIYRRLVFIGNSFRYHHIDLSEYYNGFAPSRELIIVDNDFAFFHDQTLLNDTRMYLNASELVVFAGNAVVDTVILDEAPTGGAEPIIDLMSSGNDHVQQCFILGNQFSGALYRTTATFIDWGCQSGAITGNQFAATQRYKRQAFGFDEAHPYLLRVNNNSGSVDISNNIFKVSPPSGSDYSELDVSDSSVRGILFYRWTDAGLINVSNNVFDWSQNGSIETPIDDQSFISYSTDTGAPKIQNNVFYGVTDFNLVSSNLIDEFDTSETFKANFCFGEETVGCLEQDLETAPGFEDLLDYMPGEDSPLVDAGLEGNNFLDIDGTRNDIGVYGGQTPVNQYLDQLDADNADNPLIYPLRPASEGLTTNGNLAIKVLSVSRAQ